MTVLVGPQASGKSVISKLAYFLIDLMDEQFVAMSSGQGYAAFVEKTRAEFSTFFPASAWGGGQFQITYEAGQYWIKVTRTRAGSGRLSNKVRVTFSPFFKNFYSTAFDTISSIVRADNEAGASRKLTAQWEARREFQGQLKKELGNRFFDNQLFIPAGRSFFTNAGKLVAILDEGNLIDPIVSRFGRIFASVRDHRLFIFDEPRQKAFDDEVTKILLGGKIIFERDKEYLETTDGRKVPFSAMSSGQQELVPLVEILNRWVSLRRDSGNQMIYVEEPEAHLFPAAQARIVEAFARVRNLASGRLGLLFTTHSPYVLAKLSNLMKAGAIGASKPDSVQALAKIIKRSAWIDPSSVSAYAIRNGELTSIIDREECAISGDYIDEISGSLAREFAAIIDIESKNGS